MCDIQVEKSESQECWLTCSDKNRDCLPDTCCGATPKAGPKEKSRKDRHGNNSLKGSPSRNSKEAITQASGEGRKLSGDKDGAAPGASQADEPAKETERENKDAGSSEQCL